jgi:hypothetical protein
MKKLIFLSVIMLSLLLSACNNTLAKNTQTVTTSDVNSITTITRTPKALVTITPITNSSTTPTQAQTEYISKMIPATDTLPAYEIESWSGLTIELISLNSPVPIDGTLDITIKTTPNMRCDFNYYSESPQNTVVNHPTPIVRTYYTKSVLSDDNGIASTRIDDSGIGYKRLNIEVVKIGTPMSSTTTPGATKTEATPRARLTTTYIRL